MHRGVRVPGDTRLFGGRRPGCVGRTALPVRIGARVVDGGD
jgi:hypothetical protein